MTAQVSPQNDHMPFPSTGFAHPGGGGLCIPSDLYIIHRGSSDHSGRRFAGLTSSRVVGRDAGTLSGKG